MAGLTHAQVAHYRQHGWVAPVDVMGENEAGELFRLLEKAEASFPMELNAEHRNNAHLVFPFLAELALDPRIVDPAESLIGPDISLSSSVLFIKEPDSSSFVSWHQDAFYLGLEPDNFVTAWIALTPSDRQSGCVSVIPGSHEGRAEHNDTFGADNILTRGQTVAGINEASAVDLVLRPGQMSLHHPWLVHGSQPNRTKGRRVGVALQGYLGADVRPARGEHHVLAVRGAPPHTSFTTVPPPRAELAAGAVTARAAANDALSAVLYDGAERTRAL
ncbi:MAG: phytanoyl-CoA dioxygenase family protein [Acidimicrobiales bacterium]|nr:phytanoyl-CoA dioxygenase family protein [Acidimicrobiales bacterium]MDG2219418.1 phytanoyl-CoA dioxygenase family protein [Acidimicrobiales bacterium]